MTIEKIKSDLLKAKENDVEDILTDYDIKAVDQHGSNILHYFIKNRNSIKISSFIFFQELNKKGFDFDARQTKKFKRTPIALAVFENDKEIFDLLIERNVDVNLEDENGNPPLFDAVFRYNGDGYFIEKLLKAGADINKKNLYGISPYELAHTIVNTDVIKYFK